MFLRTKLGSVCNAVFHPKRGFLFCWRTAVADSGASCHMLNCLTFFINYTKTPGSYVLLADHTKVPVLGKGDAKFMLNGKIVQVPDCLHIPSLSSPLYSIRHHRRYAGCAFIADNDGCTLTFPDFIVPVDDSKDCLISIQPVPPNSGVDFKATTTQPSTIWRVNFAKHVSI